LKALIAGQQPDMTVERWTPITIPRLAAALGVAEAALDAAKEHAARHQSQATSMLVFQLALLLGAAAFAVLMVLVVMRQVTGPLRTIKDAMLKVAAGDLSADVSVGPRKDEIGALADAMHAFRTRMVEAERLRTDQKDSEARSTVRRKADMRRLA